METVEEIRKRLIESDPKLPSAKLDDVAWRQWCLAWHRRQIEAICQAASDPAQAKRLYEHRVKPIAHGLGLRQTIERLKAILVAHNLLARASEFASEPDRGKMLSPVTSNKMLTGDDWSNK